MKSHDVVFGIYLYFGDWNLLFNFANVINAIFEKRRWIDKSNLENIMVKAEEFAKMIVGLIKSIRKTME